MATVRPASAAARTVKRKPRAAQKEPAEADGARSRLTPEAWIDAATEVLVDQGIDHVRVDVLATQLGVTRGSFYWHFRDREDLLRRVLQAWRDRATDQLTRRLENTHQDSPQQRLRDVISLPHRGRSAAKAARIELAIRAWARRDAIARQALDEADAARLGYHEALLRELGWPEYEARLRAFTLYSCEIAESLLVRQGTPGDRQARREMLEGLMSPAILESAPPKRGGLTRHEPWARTYNSELKRNVTGETD